ncbi:FKBP-type peptidyl-prolyl cis-trans isomerase [Sphingomonas sp.]|uniref:FKBP-type peptidyl-prolyl cis-trans isomerase n=1 Tax=Sphingomonas sp. TaxID=28214 RepID=UPI001EC9FB26|nr:FKBP-type peptidyl-prolyl cis-trans isomerase [Sphingomonas sp.]MBX3594735.1 FKBP-type peptidyl-prolyl cis-trans isomerase [Sphingomonas sp.]
MSNVTAVPIPPTKRSYLAWIWIGVVAAVAGAVALAWFGTAEVVEKRMTGAAFLAANKGKSGVVETASGLQYQVLEEGKGASPTDNDVALVNYKGMLRDGTVFDQSRQPTPLPVAGMIPGFTEALKLMKKGGKYRVWIKPELGYGSEAKTNPQTGQVVIPADSLLIFDVDLIEFIPRAVYEQMMQQQMGGAPGGAGTPPPQGR